MKRFFALALAILMVVVALPHTPAKAQGKSLQVYVTGIDQKLQDWFNNTAIPAFQKDNPDVTVSIITGGWGDFDTSVAGWITTGKGPDIVYLGSEYASTYGKLLANIDPYIKAWPDLKNYLPASLATVTYDGHMRGLPILMASRPVFYRTDLVKGGAKDFKAPLTFTAAVKFAKDNTVIASAALTQQGFFNSNPGSADGLFDAQEFIGAIWAAGGELYKKDGSSDFDSAQTKEALQFLYNRRRAVLPDEKTATLPAFQGPPIASGKVVSGIFPMWNMPPIGDKLWDNIDIEPNPAGAAGKPNIQVYTDWLSVPAYSPNPDLAASFLMFLGSKDNALAMNTIEGFVPVRTDAWDTLKASPVWNKILTLTQQYGRGFNGINASADLRPMLVEQVNLYLTDQKNLADTQASLKKEYDAILTKDGFLGGGAAAATAAPTAAATAVSTASK